MKEIGGYLEFETLISKPYYSNLIAVNSARHALIYILKARRAKKIYLPFFLCDSVQKACVSQNIPMEFYNIDREFLPVFDKTLSDGEWLYIVNYYGQIDNESILMLKQKYRNVIVDNVQAFFQKPVTGIDTIYSCRKFFGVPDGGYVSTDAVLDEKLDTDISMMRLRHLTGRYEGESASEYYNDFKKNDKVFADAELRKMSRFTRNILGAIEYEDVIAKRESNFSCLASLLGDINVIAVHKPPGPYAYPFYCRNGMSVKKQLAEKKIFVATLWPNVLDMEDSVEKEYAENILPLPCDQRYDENDMKYVAEVLKECIK